jgi:hypothetical protein
MHHSCLLFPPQCISHIGVIGIETYLPLPNVLACQQHWLICRLAGPYATSYRGETPRRWEETWLVDEVCSRTIVDETWLRGALPTDQNGVAQFTMSVLDRLRLRRWAVHVHTKVFPEWEPSPNRSFLVNLPILVNFIFDDDISMQVDKAHIPLFLVAESHPRYRRTRN